jgi:hypothetical protein
MAEAIRLVEFDRSPLTSEILVGFVLDASEALTLLQVFDFDFTLSGYTVVRNEDVRRYRYLDEPGSFVARALKLQGIKPMPPQGISLDSLPNVLSSASEQYPLITIHREKISDEVCYIGRLVEIKGKTFTLMEIDTDAEWDDKPHRFRLGDVTKVDFGGRYEQALHLVDEENRRLKTASEAAPRTGRRARR